MFSRIGAAAYRKDLTNTRTLCEALEQPHLQFPAVHIAGTNGKGSVSHMLAAVFQQAGYKTGLYTSPHLRDFRERIKINGKMVPESFVIRFTEQIRPLAEKINPSFFEITVAMAFAYFAEEKTDIAIIETGMGGRFDSTNIITPELSVITNIGFDHMQFLGDSLEQIAFEKAGIIKSGVPVVIGEVLPETRPVFEKAAGEKQSPLSVAAKERQVLNWEWKQHLLRVEVADPHHADHTWYELDLPGIYQCKNLLTVLEALHILRKKGWMLDGEQVHMALRHTKKMTGLHGRWEIIAENPALVLDVAHNPDGIQQLLQQVELTPHEQLHIVLGVVKDKDVSTLLRLLPVSARYYFTQAAIPRAMPADVLAAEAATNGLDGAVFPDVNLAIRAARSQAGAADLIVVCGSIFLAGEVDYYFFS